ncbi:MAG TPA: hypothetical protein VKE95_13570 [Burkholderiales bacterium]|nr:hypothetical protein [Burkholderiales bacterium]
MSEQAEEFETPSEQVLATRHIPWVPLLAFAQIVSIFTIFFSVFSLT